MCDATIRLLIRRNPTASGVEGGGKGPSAIAGSQSVSRSWWRLARGSFACDV